MCQVWQHISCVIIPEKTMEGNPPVPDLFYCEICRLSRADPYVSLLCLCACVCICAHPGCMIISNLRLSYLL